MPFPEWGHSYNALYVPLKGGWQCALIPARDIEDVDRGWRLSYEKRQKARKEREERMERDRRDFDQLFRTGISRISADYRAYAGFIKEYVRGRWHTPIDGEDITRILRDAVRDGLIVAAIDRNRRGGDRVSKRYAARAWPKRAPDPKPTVYASRNGQFYPMDSYGNVLDERYYAPVVTKAAASASNADSSGGGIGWLSAIETAGGDDSGGDSMLKRFGASDGGGLSLGDAQPFEFKADGLLDQAQEVAGVFLTPAEEAECELQYNLDMTECSAYAAMDKGYWGVCKERARQRYSNCLIGRSVG